MIYFSWATQIILAIISFLWLIPYYIAFKVGNRKYMSKTLDLSCNNRYTLMYYSGFFISILWYIMPFLNQPKSNTVGKCSLQYYPYCINWIFYVCLGY